MMKKGFTLIELLVVIAIIALLTSIVLANLKASRDKAADAAIKQDLVNLRSSVELFYANNGNSYGPITNGDCTQVGSMFQSANIKPIIANLSQNSTTVTCYSSATLWAVSAQLKTNIALAWCVDSKQSSKQISGTINSTSCP